MKSFVKNADNVILLGLSLIVYHFAYGLSRLNPLNINWLFQTRQDWATHYLGWAFYRESAWTFPLGNMTGYMHPMGTNIGFTDSIPLLALPLKLISFALPQDFQYIGIWFLACLFLNGYFTLKLLKLFGVSRVMRLIFSAFILISPIVIVRQIHPALCAHWLLIGSLYYYFLSGRQGQQHTAFKGQMILLGLSCFITPY